MNARRLAAALALATTVAAASAGAQSNLPPGSECVEFIGPRTAEQLFEHLRNARTSDQCTLDNVRTERTQMFLLYAKRGDEVPRVVIEPVSCARAPTVAGPTLALEAPEKFRAACPGAYAAVAALVQSTGAPEAPEDLFFPSGIARASGFFALAALAFAALLAARSLRAADDESAAGPDDPSR